MHEDLLNAVTNLGSPIILVVGDFMLDVYVYGDAARISPEAPVPVLKVTRTEYRCGGAASVAVDLAALGAQGVCIGLIGDDPNGQILLEKLQQSSVDITDLTKTADRPTTTKQRLIGLAQHRHPQQLIRTDYESTTPLSAEQRRQILHRYQRRLSSADAICLQDYNKGLLDPDLCKEMIRLARQAGKKVLVDPAVTDNYTKYTGATVLTPNRKEASVAVGSPINDQTTAAKAAERLLHSLQLEAVVITLDKEGAYLRSAHDDLLIPTRPRSVYDVTGAGDMVLATLAVAVAAGLDYRSAVHLANLAGGIEVEKFGTATVTVDEIIHELVTEHHRQSGKLRSRAALVKELAWHRKQNHTIVFTNGCFDVIHRGHIEYLKFCKQQGDIVVVGLNSDKSVKTIKGPDRPINNQTDRAAVLDSLESVDYITIFDEPTPIDLIKQVRPDILVKGQDWAQKGVVGREFVESYGGKVLLAPLVPGKSSTSTIQKIKTLEVGL